MGTDSSDLLYITLSHNVVLVPLGHDSAAFKGSAALLQSCVFTCTSSVEQVVSLWFQENSSAEQFAKTLGT